MRIGILSDTHDQLARTEFAVELLCSEGAEALFHCGDLTEPSIVAACSLRPCYFVFGNNDGYYVPQIKQSIADVGNAICLDWGGEVTLAGKRIAMTHGHLEAVADQLLASIPDYFFSGHSHVARDWNDGQTRHINPGALYRASSFSVALLDLNDDSLQFLKVPR